MNEEYSCETCYWMLTGCKCEANICSHYYPNAYDDVFQSPEPEYCVKSKNVWERNGFTIIQTET